MYKIINSGKQVKWSKNYLSI